MALITESLSSVKKNISKDKKSSLAKKVNLGLPKERLLEIHDYMVKSRVLEERLIKIYKVGDAYFWIGGPGEEAFGVPLGMLIKKGQGHNHDWLHLHYRCTPTLVAMGMPMIDSIRLIMNKATDQSTGGRNFSNHYCYPQWNVAPVSSPIEVQYSMAIGTAWAQRREKAKGISVVTGGDAGSAEGDFATCLIWASRPGNELPLLITVQNNAWGISTEYHSQHGEEKIADRGKAFGIKSLTMNGNDPIESYLVLQESMEYIRKNQKPVLLETYVSRLNGHSSATGAAREEGVDCLLEFEQKLFKAGVLKQSESKEIWESYEKEGRAAQEQVQTEPTPDPESIWDHIYQNNENGDWRKF